MLIAIPSLHLRVSTEKISLAPSAVTTISCPLLSLVAMPQGPVMKRRERLSTILYVKSSQFSIQAFFVISGSAKKMWVELRVTWQWYDIPIGK